MQACVQLAVLRPHMLAETGCAYVWCCCRSGQQASTSGRSPTKPPAWDAEAIKESLARLRAARQSTVSEVSSKDFRIPAVRCVCAVLDCAVSNAA